MSTREPGKAPQDQLLDHDYDGIHEYDNPMPRWWLLIFYATILYAVLYFLNVVPGLGSGKGRIADYEKAVAEADARRAATAPPAVTVTDSMLVAATHDPAQLAKGKEVFGTTCAPCHVADGGGLVGPNLTDRYWIHGGKPLQIYHTISTGVPDKGMPAWGLTLPQDQVVALAAYVITLRGTHPANPKEPQGVPEDGAEDAGKR
jgi:cytochrome c oxidase cbb3-type subunit 3